MKYIAFIGIALLFMACSNSDPKSKSNENETTEFIECISVLPEIEMPYQVYCEDCCMHPDLEGDTEKLISYLPEGSTPVGILSMDENFVTVLVTYAADWFVPSVVVFDRNGEVLSQESFLSDWCGRGIDYINNQYLLIDEDLTITEIDTAYNLNFDFDLGEVIDTIDMDVVKDSFIINQDGIIEHM